MDYVGYDPGKGFPHLELLGDCRLIFIQVGTPESNGDLDNTAVQALVRDLAELPLEDGALLVLKSTVPPGTNDQLARDYPQYRFASAPEFLIQEDPLNSFLKPDRIVIGARTLEDRMAIALPLADACGVKVGDGKLIFVTPIEAELLKLSANTILAAKVALANELFGICEAYGVSWSAIQYGIGMDSRIGQSHLTVTDERGFGGACFPKDLHGLIAAAYRADYIPRLLTAIDEANDRVRLEAKVLSHAASMNKAENVGGST
jgi:UDPglucose 6-dehydrogenase